MTKLERERYVKVTTVYGPAEAEIVKAKLESEEIKVILKADSLRTLYGIHINGLGKVEIWVKKEDEERAKTLLASSPPEDKEG